MPFLYTHTRTHFWFFFLLPFFENHLKFSALFPRSRTLFPFLLTSFHVLLHHWNCFCYCSRHSSLLGNWCLVAMVSNIKYQLKDFYSSITLCIKSHQKRQLAEAIGENEGKIVRIYSSSSSSKDTYFLCCGFPKK